MSDLHPDSKVSMRSFETLDPAEGMVHIVIGELNAKPIEVQDLHDVLGHRYEALKGLMFSKLSGYESQIRANLDAAKGQGAHVDIDRDVKNLADYIAHAPQFFPSYDAALVAAKQLDDVLYARAQSAVDGKKTWLSRTARITGDPAHDAFAGVTIQNITGNTRY